MEFLSKKEIMKFYRNIRSGDRIEITRDLSKGKMDEDMIQTLGIQVLPKNSQYIGNLLFDYPVIELKFSKDDNYRR